MPRNGTRRNRRRPVWIGALALVVALATLAVVLLVRDTDSGAPSSLDQGNAPPAPVALAPDTSYVSTRVRPNGALVVEHWIRSDVQVFGVTLELPRGSSDRVDVQGITVYADGTLVRGDRSLQRSSAFFPTMGARDLYVRYRLVGAVERSGSTPERALARVTALHVGLDQPLTLVTRVVRGEVLALACMPEGRPRAVPCGSPADGGWQVELERGRVGDSVMAQLDLP